MLNKPSSVPARGGVISIYLDPMLPSNSCRRTMFTVTSITTIWCDYGLPSLHQTGFTTPLCCQSREGLLKPYVSSLPRQRRGGLVSVALSLGSPPAAVNGCLCSLVLGLSSPAKGGGRYLSHSRQLIL